MPLKHRAKILATLGPSSNSDKIVTELLNAGTDGFRLNTSHRTLTYHKNSFEMIRSVNDKVPILVDLPGVKIRTGILKKAVNVENGQQIKLASTKTINLILNESADDIKIFPVDYDNLAKDVKIGDSIFINDGIIHLKVTDTQKDKQLVFAEVQAGGLIESRKGINLPDSTLKSGVPTKEDEERIKFACEVDADYLALSFVSYSSEIDTVRSIIDLYSKRQIPIIAKIERQKAIENFSDILHNSNGVMVARGDLGVEIPPERVPVEQRKILLEANRASKLCIVATQMLDSMIRNPVATRAEISDIFTAVDQGADAVMLSGETASGDYPIKAVEVMYKVVNLAHTEMSSRRKPADYDSKYNGYVRIQELLGHAVKTMSKKARSEGEPIKAIIIPTRYGSTAKVIAKYRPSIPIIASSPNIHVIRELNLIWGLHTYHIQSKKMITESLYTGGLSSDLFRLTLKRCMADNVLDSNDMFIAVSSSAISPYSPTNLVGLFSVKDIPLH